MAAGVAQSNDRGALGKLGIHLRMGRGAGEGGRKLPGHTEAWREVSVQTAGCQEQSRHRSPG